MSTAIYPTLEAAEAEVIAIIQALEEPATQRDIREAIQHRTKNVFGFKQYIGGNKNISVLLDYMVRFKKLERIEHKDGPATFVVASEPATTPIAPPEPTLDLPSESAHEHVIPDSDPEASMGEVVFREIEDPLLPETISGVKAPMEDEVIEDEEEPPLPPAPDPAEEEVTVLSKTYTLTWDDHSYPSTPETPDEAWLHDLTIRLSNTHAKYFKAKDAVGTLAREAAELRRQADAKDAESAEAMATLAGLIKDLRQTVGMVGVTGLQEPPKGPVAPELPPDTAVSTKLNLPGATAGPSCGFLQAHHVAQVVSFPGLAKLSGSGEKFASWWMNGVAKTLVEAKLQSINPSFTPYVDLNWQVKHLAASYDRSRVLSNKLDLKHYTTEQLCLFALPAMVRIEEMLKEMHGTAYVFSHYYGKYQAFMAQVAT